MKELPFKPAYQGLGTEFSESDQPPEFARELENRFINIYGAAEIRPGLSQIESPATKFFDGSNFTTVTGKCDLLLEYSSPQGLVENLCSLIQREIDPSNPSNTVTFRTLNRYSSSAQAWVAVNLPDDPNVPGVSGLSFTTTFDPVKENDIFPAQFSEKLILAGEQYRPFFYVNDPIIGAQAFQLNPIVVQGSAASGTSASRLTDSLISDWLNGTFVKPNDLVYNVTKRAFGIITSVGASNIDCTPITSAGATSGIGITTVATSAEETMAAGDVYQILDSRELNLFKVGKSSTGAYFIDTSDNFAVAGAGTNSTTIAVSGVDFNKTQIRNGDIVYNTTRNRIARVYPANTTDGRNADGSINLSYLGAFNTGITGQVPGDSLVFFKSACPISVFPHVHYGRLYLIDERDRVRIAVTGPDDPQDFTTFDTTLNAGTINFGSQQPVAEELLTLSTFQKYLCIGGKKNVYLSDGTNPIEDVSGATVDIVPVGLFSQGVVSNLGLANIGSDMVFMAKDGARRFNILDVLQVQTDNISEVIKTELRTAIESIEEDKTKLQIIHYPKRNWVMFKVGNVIYNYNYTPFYVQGQLVKGGSWSKFTGTLAECNAFLVKGNGDLLCSFYDVSAGESYFYEFDKGYYTEASAPMSTRYKAAWSTPSGEGIVSDGRYIKPFFENVGNVNYQISVTADFQRQQTDDSVDYISSGGNTIGQWQIGQDPIGGDMIIKDDKIPLRWRGEQSRIAINTTAQTTRDQISKYVMYVNTFGRD